MAQNGPVIINKSPEVSRLEVQQAFTKLTPREQLYAHYSARYIHFDSRLVDRADFLSRAAWSSALIILD